MKPYTLPIVTLMAFSAFADVQGPPHSLTGTVSYTTVNLSWKDPAAEHTLQWHNDYSYNGISGARTDPEGSATIYAANKFTPADLIGKVGEKVTHIAYNEYRNISDVTIFIYEDGKAVYSQPVRVTDWEKDTMRKVELDTPYVIPYGKTIMFVVKKVHGYNQDFAAVCDREATAGKGNVYSFDGETWHEDAPGDFLITAYLENASDTSPIGFNVYVDGEKVNEEEITETACILKEQEEGTHKYQVSAVYAENELLSYELPLTTIDIKNLIAPVVSLKGSAKDLTGNISWSSPLLHSDELTWSGKEVGLSIGGTASTNTKVWIRQDFDSDELYFGSFVDNNITAINSYISEDAITGVTAFIMKDGAIDYYEEMPADAISAITAGDWNKFSLSEPYLLEADHKYCFGLYYLQKSGTHPVGVDNRPSVDGKANYFSTSSPSSSGFDKSNPSWRTLSSGDIEGNFMLSADVTPTGDLLPQPVIKEYAVYRDGELIGTTAENTYADEVEELGKYTYAVRTVAEDGKESLDKTVDLTYSLPSGYVTPTILSSSFDEDSGEFELSWSPDAYEMRHYGTATYITGFDEDMENLMWGAQFSAEDMADYADYKMNDITFGIGDDAIGDFDLVVMAEKEELYSLTITGGTVLPGYLYTLNLDDANLTIPEGKDIYLAYRAETVPAESTPILLDAGSAQAGGAMVSLTNGVSWLKLSTLNSGLANYNVVIGAIISPEDDGGETAKEMIIVGETDIIPVTRIMLSASELRKLEAEDRIEAVGGKTNRPKKAAPKAVSFKIYRNGEQVAETENRSYGETLGNYGTFVYNVRSVFTNGWESADSKDVTVVYRIPQKTQAPYNLKGEEENGILKLSWEAVDAEAAVKKYHDETSGNMAFGMTGSGTREGYHAIKFKEEDLTPGSKVSHIKFMLNEIENESQQRLQSCAVFVMVGEDIMYEQAVNVSDLAAGVWNVVRLNRPYDIPEGFEVAVGYHITYPTGLKPCLTDEGPAVSGYSDLVSASATSGYWYSLAAKYNLNYSYRMEAIIMAADQKIDNEKLNVRRADADMTFTVKRDGLPIAESLADMSYDVKNAAEGLYTVTAVVGSNESADSNGVQYGETTGIDTIKGSVVEAYYDADSKSVVLNGVDNVSVYGINGSLVERHLSTSLVDLSALAPGAYVIVTDGGVKVKAIR